MNKPTDILYPRHEATIRIASSKKEPILSKRIAQIEAGKIYKELLRLKEELSTVHRAKPRFVCWRCPTEKPLKDLTLFNYVSFSNTIDEDRYNDFNIVCPKCGAFSYIKDGVCRDPRFGGYEEIVS